MSTIPTVTIKVQPSQGNPNGELLINQSDYNPETMTTVEQYRAGIQTARAQQEAAEAAKKAAEQDGKAAGQDGAPTSAEAPQESPASAPHGDDHEKKRPRASK